MPEALHRKLKVRAAASGQTLSDYLLARIHGRKRVTLQTPDAVVIREERDSA